MKAVAEHRAGVLSESAKLVLNYSFIVAITYAVIFAIAKIFSLEDKVELRFLNYIMLFIIAYSALRKIYNMNDHKMEYFTGLSRTFLICVLGSFWYCILFFIYLHIDTGFTRQLLNQFPGKMVYPELSITVALFSEGFALSAIAALALMQIFKWKRGRWARQ